MARLGLIDPTDATGRAKEIFDGPLNGKHFNIFKAMANSPAALDTYLGMSGALAKTSLSAAEREVIQLVIGQANGCHYCVAAHTAIGKGAGLTEEQTVQARAGTMSDPKLNALTQFALALHDKCGYVTDEDIAAFRAAGNDDGSIAEVVAVYSLATFTNFFNHVADTEIDFPAAPELPAATA